MTVLEKLKKKFAVLLWFCTKEPYETIFETRSGRKLRFVKKETDLSLKVIYYIFLDAETDMILYYKFDQVCNLKIIEETMSNKLEVEIPQGKEIDWEESAKQKKVVFKDIAITYEKIAKELFVDGHYYINENGKIEPNDTGGEQCPNNATSEEQLECILAKNKLANVARYLNSDWKPYKRGTYWTIVYNLDDCELQVCSEVLHCYISDIAFKSKEAAEQAIKILGEKEVKLAVKTLY